MVQLELTVAGDVSTFDEEAFRTNLASSLPGVSASSIRLSVTSGSVIVVATIVTGDVQSTLSQVEQIASDPAVATAALGVSVEAVQPPRAVVALVVSPPPSTPPHPPPSPPPFFAAGAAASALSNAQTASESSEGPVSSEMIWVIIVVVIFIGLFCGCYYSFNRGKRQGKHDMKEAAKRAGLSLHPAQMAPITAVHYPKPMPASAAATDTNDALRFIELGVQLERQRSDTAQLERQRSSSSQPPSMDELSAAVYEVQRANEALHAAADRVTSSNDPRASAHLWLRDSIVSTSQSSTPMGTPKGNHTTESDVAGRV